MAPFPSTSDLIAALRLLQLRELPTRPISMESFPSTSDRIAASGLLQLRVSGNLRQSADAILEFLSGGWYKEAEIRQVLGNTADTSKALRLLAL